jgi:hypothetical protein
MTIPQLESAGFKLKMGHLQKTVREIKSFFVLEKKTGKEIIRYITWSHNNTDYIEPVRMNDTMKKLFREYEVVQ